MGCFSIFAPITQNLPEWCEVCVLDDSALKEVGVADNTVILLVSDNGCDACKGKEDDREIFPPRTVMIDGDYNLIAYHDSENRSYYIPHDLSDQHAVLRKEAKRVAAMRKQLPA